jgi:protein TonB
LDLRPAIASRPFTPPTGARSTATLVIVAGHVALVAALAASGAWQEVTRATEALEVRIVAAPQLRIAAAAPIPVPTMRPPEVHIPVPQIPEPTITMRIEPAPPKSAPVVQAAVIADAAPERPAKLEPPRADLAYLDNPAPAYPAVSKRSREQGRVMLRVRVDEKGKVEDVLIETSSGFNRLDQAAREAVSHWRFLPARLGERAVAGWALVPINFQLRG